MPKDTGKQAGLRRLNLVFVLLILLARNRCCAATSQTVGLAILPFSVWCLSSLSLRRTPSPTGTRR